MPNTNCLEGIRCPKCGQDERFEIVAEVTLSVTDNGSQTLDGNHYWDREANCSCPECEYNATVDHFTEGRLNYLTAKEEAHV